MFGTEATTTWPQAVIFLGVLLQVLRELIEAGKVTPVIDRSYPLSEVPEAIRYWGQGHARGKVVITVSRT
jgi:NADPH:quinone reductase-like Zn-dependent oxidoreductase